MLYPTVELFLELRHRVSTRTGRILFGCSSTKAACKSGRYFAGDYHAVSAPVSPGAGVCRRPKECTDSRAHRHSPAASRRDLLNFPMRALVPLGPSCRACLLSASDVCYLPPSYVSPFLQCTCSASAVLRICSATFLVLCSMSAPCLFLSFCHPPALPLHGPPQDQRPFWNPNPSARQKKKGKRQACKARLHVPEEKGISVYPALRRNTPYNMQIRRACRHIQEPSKSVHCRENPATPITAE